MKVIIENKLFKSLPFLSFLWKQESMFLGSLFSRGQVWIPACAGMTF